MNSEFLINNISAGYASYDLTDGVTRKYHGLLVAGLNNFSRQVIMPSVNEFLTVQAQKHNLSVHAYKDMPEAPFKKYLSKAYYLPNPTQILRIGGIVIRKELEFSETRNEITLNYLITTPEEAIFELEPLITLRSFHSLGLSLKLPELNITTSGKRQLISLNKSINLELNSNLNYTPRLLVSHNHYYKMEEERGYDSKEDLVIVGNYQKLLVPGYNQFQFKARIIDQPKFRRILSIPSQLADNNISIITDLSRFKLIYPQLDENFSEFLVYNARKFIVKDAERQSIIAGYHWFGEWSRDTFISFKGILLGLGRFSQAQKILVDWSKYISGGLLPNTIEGLHYNSIDGILWYFLAVYYYWEETNDSDTIQYLLPKLERAIHGLTRGSKYGIELTKEGYLAWKAKDSALTWMDSIVDGKSVTGRIGSCIEIQALWYNCLEITIKLAKATNYKLLNSTLIDQIISLIKQNFNNDFWLSSQNYYADFIDLEGRKNESLRPNQLAIYALPFRLGDLKNLSAVLAVTEKSLLTPVGLRSLAEDSPEYKSEYKGSQYDRDLAYHQGVIWVWPVLFYYLAKLKNNSPQNNYKSEVINHLHKAWEFIGARQLIGLPELFSGTNYEPAGTINQAWSISAYLETIMSLTE